MKSINPPFEIDGMKIIILNRGKQIIDFVSRIILYV